MGCAASSSAAAVGVGPSCAACVCAMNCCALVVVVVVVVVVVYLFARRGWMQIADCSYGDGDGGEASKRNLCCATRVRACVRRVLPACLSTASIKGGRAARAASRAGVCSKGVRGRATARAKQRRRAAPWPAWVCVCAHEAWRGVAAWARRAGGAESGDLNSTYPTTPALRIGPRLVEGLLGPRGRAPRSETAWERVIGSSERRAGRGASTGL